MQVIQRTISFKIELVRPAWGTPDLPAPYATFMSQASNLADHEYDFLLSYSFSESLNNLDGSFSLTFRSPLPTLYDTIELFDFVYIYEFEKLCFIGIINQVSWSARMSSDGGQRSCSINGSSVSGLLSSYKLILDQAIFLTSLTAQTAQERLATKLAVSQNSGEPVRGLIITVYHAWIAAMEELAVVASGSIAGLLQKVFDLDAMSEEVVMWYPASYSIFTGGEQSLLSVLQQFVQPPLMEFYALPDHDTRKLKFYLRLVPFGLGSPLDIQSYLGSWAGLRTTTLPLASITNATLVRSNSNVFTYYLAYLESAGFNGRAAMAVGSGSTAGYKIDKARWLKYGYRPLVLPLRFFNRGTTADLRGASIDVTKKLSGVLQEVFQMNDSLSQGTVDFMTLPEGPRIGEKVKIENSDAQFYVEQASHSWSYGGPMATAIQVSRGALYKNTTPVMSIASVDTAVGPGEALVPPGTPLNPTEPPIKVPRTSTKST